jgi:hypothetical protein
MMPLYCLVITESIILIHSRSNHYDELIRDYDSLIRNPLPQVLGFTVRSSEDPRRPS